MVVSNKIMVKERSKTMAKEIRYGKPNMAALPRRLGEKILKQIAETPPMDMNKINREADKAREKFKKGMEEFE